MQRRMLLITKHHVARESNFAARVFIEIRIGTKLHSTFYATFKMIQGREIPKDANATRESRLPVH